MVSEFDIEQTRAARVDWDELRRSALQLLGANGFELVHETHELLEFRGPGMHNTQQAEIRAATFIRLIGKGDHLTIQAELGGARFLIRFVKIFPLALGVGIAVILGLVFSLTLPNPILGLTIAGLIAVVDVALWSILGPIMARSIQRRGENAVSSFFTNLISMASVDSRRN
ncbi:MAG: hypothetical protein KDA83_15165 [Planctomycetales bacterium]|nr:hypothetical protein [Planctomycetales bacterium]